MKPDLKFIQKDKVVSFPYDEQRGVKRMLALRAQLLAASVRYVAEGKTGTPQDRIRKASDLAGIPRTLIEVAYKANSNA